MNNDNSSSPFSRIRPVGLIVLLAGIITTGMCFQLFSSKGHKESASTVKILLPSIKTVAQPVDRILPAVRSDGILIEPELPPSLKLVLDSKSNLSFQRRLESVHELPTNLSLEESRSLLAYVQACVYPQALSQSENMALVNDILNVLQRQESIRPELIKLLEDLSGDNTKTPVMRDYALQHLASLSLVKTLYDSKSVVPSWSAHWTMAQSSDPLLASGAMLRLMTASRAGVLDSSERSRLEGLAVKLAANPSNPNASRMTALQVCGQLRSIGISDIAYNIARSTEESFPLRISAVATLGQTSDPNSSKVREYLNGLTKGPEQRLRVPATEALKQLDKKVKSS